jgi:hypothetical protein
MPILEGDLKFLKSERLNDASDGGGRMTGVAVIDGQSNNLFPDVSELDRVMGRVQLRKVFPAALTDDSETYMGANMIVLDPPDDPAVSVTLFTASSWADERNAAADRISSYLAEGPLWNGYLYGNHIAGQRALQIIQRPEDPLPEIGQTLVLTAFAGLPSEKKQYVRLTDVTVLSRAFTFEGNPPIEYQRNVITVEISEPLAHDFPGTEANRYDKPAVGATAVRDTIVADAAQYFGIAPLTEAAGIGDLRVQAQSLFTRIVPSLESETPLTNLNAAGENPALVAAGASFTFSTSASFGPGTSLFLGGPCYPGSLTITAGGATLTDSAGQLLSAGTAIGTVDYARGEVRLAPTAPTYSGSKTISFKPAAAPARPRISAALPVTVANRGFNYAVTLVPPPQPASLLVSYMAQGKWYDLRDYGGGNIRGAQSAYGAGSIDYSTGTVVVTLGALPDDGSVVLMQWSTKSKFFDRSGATATPLTLHIQADVANLHPNSVSVTGPGLTLADDGDGLLTGTGGSGTIDYATGLAIITPTTLPSAGASYTLDFDTGTANTTPVIEDFDNPSMSGGVISLELAHNNLLPRTVRLEFFLKKQFPELGGERDVAQYQRRDNGAGGFPAISASLNYETGELSFTPAHTASFPVRTYQFVSTYLASA